MLPRAHELLAYHPQIEAGRVVAVHVFESRSGRFFRLTDEETELLRALDGRRDPAALVAEMRGRGILFDEEFVTAFCGQAMGLGLLEGSRPLPGDGDSGKPWFDRLLLFKIPLVDPSRWLRVPALVWSVIYSRRAAPLWLLLVATAVWLVCSDPAHLAGTGLEYLSPAGLPWLLLGILIAKTGHEFAHAAASRRHGAPVREMGVAFLLFMPCLYCETSSSWALPHRRQRLEIGVAGVLFEILLGAVGALLWYATVPGFWNSLGFALMAVSWIESLLFNANPLLRFDGYFVLSEMLRMPNLALKARQRLRYLLFHRWLGRDDVRDPARSPREGRILTIYAVLAAVYRCLLAILIAQFLAAFFLPPVGLVVMLFVLWRFLLRPGCVTLLEVWRCRARLRPRLWPSTAAALCVSLLSAVFFVPFAWPRVYPCQVEAADARPLYAPFDGSLASWTAKAGQRVGAGDVLGSLDTSAIRHLERLAQIDVDAARRELSGKTGSEANRRSYPEIEERLGQANDRVEYAREEIAGARIAAPAGGRVIELEDGLDPGALLQRGQRLGVLAIGEGRRVAAIVRETDVRFLSPGAFVEVWLPMGHGRSVAGRVVKVDRQALDRLANRALAHRHGGAVPTSLNARREERPLLPFYRVLVELTGGGTLVPLGMRGRLVVPGRARPLVSSLIAGILRQTPFSEFPR